MKLRALARIGALAIALAAGCGGAEPRPDDTADRQEESSGGPEESAGFSPGTAADAVPLAADPRLRLLPHETRWLTRVDVTRVRGTAFEAALYERFKFGAWHQEIPADVMARVESVLVGGSDDEMRTILTGDLAPAREAGEGFLASSAELTPGTVNGSEALVGPSGAFVVLDDRNWLYLRAADVSAVRWSDVPPTIATQGTLERSLEAIDDAAGAAPALVEFFIADDDEEVFRDIALYVRYGCTDCEAALVFDAVATYADESTATAHGEAFARMFEDFGHGDSDITDLGVDPNAGFVRTSGPRLRMQQPLAAPPHAFHETLVMLFILGVSEHPPNLGL